MSAKTPKPVMTNARKTNAGRRGGWLQLATYPQSPFSGPARCCDVTDLYQAFSQRTGPGRLWISLVALLQQPISATEKQLTTAQPFRRSVIHLSAMYPNRCQRSFRSKHSAPSHFSPCYGGQMISPAVSRAWSAVVWHSFNDLPPVGMSMR